MSLSQSQGMMGESMGIEPVECAYCSATGKYLNDSCPVCKGLGFNKLGEHPCYHGGMVGASGSKP